MGYNFPNSPALNATYTPAGGPTYSWNGVAWQAVVQGVPVTVYVSDTAPPQPALGQLWWNSANGTMAIWYADADSAQWVQVSGAVSAKPTAETRNRVINGAFQISQENGVTQAAPVATLTYFVADQFSARAGLSTGAIRARSSLSGGPDNLNFAELNVTTAQASLSAAHSAFIEHPIEGINIKDFLWGTAAARQVVLRFWIQVTAVTGTYCVRIANGDYTRSYIAQFSVPTANVWQEVNLVIPGDKTGTWPTTNAQGAILGFNCAFGTSYHGVAGWQAGNLYVTSAAVNGVSALGQYRIANVGLYLDPLVTGIAPPWTMPDEAEELRACQRYYDTLTVTFSGNCTTSNTYYARANYRVVPRTTPSATGANVGAVSFPATVGTLSPAATTGFAENRIANATASGAFTTNVVLNARM